MKKFILATAFIVLLTGFASAQQKIGVVDLTRVITEYHRFKEATNQLQDDAAKAQKQINERLELRRKLTEDINKLRSEIADPILNEAVKTKKNSEFQEKSQELLSLERETMEFRNRRQRQITDQQNRLFTGIREEVLSIASDKAGADGYDFIFEKSSLALTRVNGLVVPPLIHASGAVDVTDDLLAQLNKDAPAAAAPAPAKEAAAAQ